ncbi:unnamed protein product [Paramecium octaurelia]|uniref:Uncharacterized protein n=1 Tax=Paramecium octaurelia TaxID=43137 RepID=A0A8S1XVR2_PAROT|nr:unnamed protein product [Paramecium octaurelia]CAD8205483.1 unnamed protein product [Paramecium octaurelia]
MNTFNIDKNRFVKKAKEKKSKNKISSNPLSLNTSGKKILMTQTPQLRLIYQFQFSLQLNSYFHHWWPSKKLNDLIHLCILILTQIVEKKKFFILDSTANTKPHF